MRTEAEIREAHALNAHMLRNPPRGCDAYTALAMRFAVAWVAFAEWALEMETPTAREFANALEIAHKRN